MEEEPAALAAAEAEIWQALIARRQGAGAPLPAAASPAAALLVELYGPLCQIPRGRPFAIAHLGQSLDGRIATASGASRWLTGEADLLHTHRLRALADAVLVGAGTIRHDDPQLTVRRCAGTHPVRVVIDAERRLGPDHRVFQDGAAPTLLLAADDAARNGGKLGRADILALSRDAQGGLAPAAIRTALAARGLHFLFIEGGGVTISRFLAADALDRLQLTVAPLLMGSGRPSLALPEIAEPREGLRPPMRRFSLGDDMLYDCVLHE